MASIREVEQLRPETPTRALLRRVQKRSSAGGSMAPPPLPSKEGTEARKSNNQRVRSRMSSASIKLSSSESNEQDLREKLAAMKGKMEGMKEEMERKDTLILALEEQLVEATDDRQAGSTSGGLTRAAAIKLEREFASQERILQGLQKDTEAKTIEVERCRREKKLMVEHLSRHYGSDDWETVVFGPSSSLLRSNSIDGSTSKKGSRGTPVNDGIIKNAFTARHSSTPIRSFKSQLARIAPSSEHTINDASFYSADESFMEPSNMVKSPLPTTNTDITNVLAFIETQKLLIKGFERSNAIKMIECREQMTRAMEKETLWDEKLKSSQLAEKA